MVASLSLAAEPRSPNGISFSLLTEKNPSEMTLVFTRSLAGVPPIRFYPIFSRQLTAFGLFPSRLLLVPFPSPS